MSEEYGNDFLTITDEDGNEFDLEHLDTFEVGGNIYMAFLPADMDEDDEDFGLVLLKVYEDNDGENSLLSITDEDELNAVHERFLQLFSEEEDTE